MTQAPELRLALTFDAEMDAFDASFAPRESAEWRGIEDGVPLIEMVLEGVCDCDKKRAVATWFVRCDDQIEYIAGSASYLFDRYAGLWRRRQQLGDEIAFHTHLYRQESGGWSQDKEPLSLRAQILRSYSAMMDAGFSSKVSRIGEAFCTNAVMDALEECGVQIDSTAMPGRVRIDAERNLDWSMTPEHAYYPSVDNYGSPGDPARKLLEIPMSMLRTEADYDRKPLLRYLDLSFHPRALRKGISDLVKTAEIIVAVTHPSAVLTSTIPHGLISFSADAFAENLDSLLRECARQERPIKFITLAQTAY